VGIFIQLRIDPDICQVADGCDLCVRLCPVAAFRIKDAQVEPIFDNEDECTLCDLCVSQCPGSAIEIIKQY
jgi:NAD-dependent dihydropyrimidine dehydrogenase PreA subunit